MPPAKLAFYSYVKGGHGTHRRRDSRRCGGALVFHLLTSLANISEGLGVIAWLSPFHYYLGSDPLINGMDWGDSAVLAALPIVLFGLSFVLFQRRDIRQRG